MSLAKPIPSVLSPRILPSSNHTSVLTAPAAKARSECSSASAKLLLERNGYIRTLPTLGAKRRNGLGKTADFGTNAPIFDGRAFLKCELLMDLRRFTVCNRVAENGVTGGVVHKTGLKKQKKKSAYYSGLYVKKA